MEGKSLKRNWGYFLFRAPEQPRTNRAAAARRAFYLSVDSRHGGAQVSLKPLVLVTDKC